MNYKLKLRTVIKLTLACAFLAYFQCVSVASAQEPELPALMKEKLLKIEADPDFTRMRETFSRNPTVKGFGKSRFIDKLTILTQTDADDLASFLSRYVPGSTFDGLCSFRNFFWHILLARLKVKAGSVTVHSPVRNLKPRDKKTGVQHEWYYHIAPAVCVNEVDGFCS